jgi:hypothetical protein
MTKNVQPSQAHLAPYFAVAWALFSPAACVASQDELDPAAPSAPPDGAKVGWSQAIGGANYMFSLNDSAGMLRTARAECSSAHNDDEAREYCFQTALNLSATEGIRFERRADGRWVWVAFGKTREGGEVFYNRLPFAVVYEATSRRLVLRPVGDDEGSKPLAPPPAAMIFETPNEETVVLHDAKRGELVFKKR